MEVVGLIVIVVVAVCGWILNGRLARRGDRRSLRVEYLLSAYRTLNRVGHREITADQLKGLETAIADEFLLGNERQIQLARQFSDDFAQSGDGDVAGPLEDLRIDLRRESLLGDAGARTTWLWVEPGTAWIAAEAMVVANLAEADQRPARSTLQGYTERSQQGDGSETLRDIEDAYARLASLVVELIRGLRRQGRSRHGGESGRPPQSAVIEDARRPLDHVPSRHQ